MRLLSRCFVFYSMLILVVVGCSRKEISTNDPPVSDIHKAEVPQAEVRLDPLDGRTKYRKKWVVVVGINSYEPNKTGFRLKCAINDAELIRVRIEPVAVLLEG